MRIPTNFLLSPDPLFDKRHTQEDVTYQDYRLKSNSPVWKLDFNPIEYDKIGLLPGFTYNTDRIRNVADRIEAESYNRMKGLRPIAATGIYHMEPAAWAKYDGVDFSKEEVNQCVINYVEKEAKLSGLLFELRIDSPSGELIGKVNAGDKIVSIKKVKGIHNLYLIFRQPVALDSFCFRKVSD